MADLIANAYLIDWVLAAFVAEGLLLMGYRASTGKGLGYAAIAANLLSGGMIVLALRAAVSGARAELVAVCLLASLAAHIIDLRQRWNR